MEPISREKDDVVEQDKVDGPQRVKQKDVPADTEVAKSPGEDTESLSNDKKLDGGKVSENENEGNVTEVDGLESSSTNAVEDTPMEVDEDESSENVNKDNEVCDTSVKDIIDNDKSSDKEGFNTSKEKLCTIEEEKEEGESSTSESNCNINESSVNKDKSNISVAGHVAGKSVKNSEVSGKSIDSGEVIKDKKTKKSCDNDVQLVDDNSTKDTVQKESSEEPVECMDIDMDSPSGKDSEKTSEKESEKEVKKDSGSEKSDEVEITEFVHYNQDKDDSQLENQPEAEDPFGGDNLSVQVDEAMEVDSTKKSSKPIGEDDKSRDTDDNSRDNDKDVLTIDETDGEVDKKQEKATGDVSEEQSDAISEKSSDKSSNPSKEKSNETEKEIGTEKENEAEKENEVEEENDAEKANETEKEIEMEKEIETVKENETDKENDKDAENDEEIPKEKSDSTEVLPGQDDELCIIPDSTKENKSNEQEKDQTSISNDLRESTQGIDAEKSSASNDATEKLMGKNKASLGKTTLTSDTNKVQANVDKPNDGKSIVTSDVIDVEDDPKNPEIEEIVSKEVCKQCKKETPCTLKVKVGNKTFSVCSEVCKNAFAADNNKATDIPSEGVNSKREKRCASCLLIVESKDEKNLSWETMEFCNEECLGKFQIKYGSYCRNCNGTVQPVSLGKYCVRFGYDVRQFCCSTCLEEFKKGLKVCSYCQKDISAGIEGFLAPVGDKGQFKDFCTQDCMGKYSKMNSTEPPVPETKVCGVCQEEKVMFCEVQIDRNPSVAICSEPCFAAFKFVNKVDPDQCTTCKKYFQLPTKTGFVVFYEDEAHNFCNKTCLNVFIITNRKIVPCNWCKVKKYNFDMIKKELKNGQVMMMCSLNCLTLYQVSINAVSARRINCDFCKEFSQAQYHLTMSDATIRNFCSYNCVMKFQSQYTKSPITIPSSDGASTDPVPTSGPKRTVIPAPVVPRTTQSTVPNEQPSAAKKTMPVISSVTSLASIANGQAQSTVQIANAPQAIAPAIQPITLQGSAPVVYKQQVITRPTSPIDFANKMTQCKPLMHTKGVSVRPIPTNKSTQTETQDKLILPIPVPMYVPFPVHMYSMPFPVPVPIPIPIPVPIFIPTTRNSAKGIMKEMKKIQDKTPSDPYEAELLMMAEMVATDKKNESDSESNDEPRDDADDANDANDAATGDSYNPEGADSSNAFGEDVLQMALNMATDDLESGVDIENALGSNTIQTPQRNLLEDIENEMNISQKSGRKRPGPGFKLVRTAAHKRAKLRSTTNDVGVLQAQDPQAGAQRFESVEKPDANMALKYTFGVNAWRQWVITKNAELEKQCTPTRKLKLFKTDLLQLTADELNYSLCLFLKEVRKPNGAEYAPDTVYYLCLGIQQYLFENNRIDNIFTDAYYEKFTDCLDEIAKKFTTLYDDTMFVVTRVEEEHLWECKQLGAHSPHVLLNTLMYFNTKHFNLVTVEEHMQLSFSHIMKHWKRNPAAQQPVLTGKAPGARNVLLRFYPPQSALEANSKKKKVYEQQENEDNPLRCPVKLYEFYLSKCPESVKTRNDVFYLLPERSCVPDSPVWYSTSPLAKENLVKMLYRIRMVKEINEAFLSS